MTSSPRDEMETPVIDMPPGSGVHDLVFTYELIAGEDETSPSYDFRVEEAGVQRPTSTILTSTGTRIEMLRRVFSEIRKHPDARVFFRVGAMGKARSLSSEMRHRIAHGEVSPEDVFLGIRPTKKE